ncbi:MAG: hypothetical protein ABIE42_09715 [Candidatus Eisenbacteria bacterium]
MIVEHPGLLPVVEFGLGDSPIVTAFREVQSAAGPIDVLGFDADGGITIIECKLARNDEIRRVVIGQVLDYAAALKGIRYDELNDRCVSDQGAEIVDVILKAQGAVISLQDRDELRKHLDETLRLGTFRLVILADGLRPSLSRIVSFLAGAEGGGVNLCVLEMRRYHDADRSIIVPVLHGSASVYRASKRKIHEPVWYDALLDARRQLEDGGIPDGSVLYPPKSKVGMWAHGHYIQLNPEKGAEGTSTFLWEDPKDGCLYTCVNLDSQPHGDLSKALSSAFPSAQEPEHDDDQLYVLVHDPSDKGTPPPSPEHLAEMLAGTFTIAREWVQRHMST